MKKGLMLAVVAATLALSGCVAVPAYGPAYGDPYGYGYGYGAPVAVAPPAVVVQPSFYGRYSYYGPRGRYYR